MLLRYLIFGWVLVGLIGNGLPSADAASVEIEFRVSEIFCGGLDPGAACAAVPNPLQGGTVLDGFVTTDADILSFTQFQVMDLPDGREPGFFNIPPPFGSDLSPPNPAFFALNRALELDSWLTTPSETLWVLPPGVDPGPWYQGGLYPFVDDSDDGPQDMFHFARLTFLPDSGGIFSGEIVVAGENGPESFPFSIVVPEPTSLTLVGLCLLGIAGGHGRVFSRSSQGRA